MLGPNRTYPSLALGIRTGLFVGLLVLLAGLFWSWVQVDTAPAHRVDVDGDAMVVWAMAEAEEEDLEPSESALGPSQDLICRKPTAPYTPGADQGLSEITDQDIPSCPGLWIALPHGVPALEPQPELPQAERQPLLRPPARLG
jgi:hypothetical protein